ncbi:hypothetical protein INT47_004689 [Mucor saturninus]|uniref:Transposase n=1 Tax=Mucor saturninus TaxID=64648 RepID=A0A8H7URK4_9FUNG|nr:hypothetical protein INT47_004689 [Mucor saturninus]
MPRTTRNTRSNNVDNEEMPLRVTRRAYRSRVPTAGDRNLQVVEESNNENAMQYLRQIGAFNTEMRCEYYPLCDKDMIPFIRTDARDQIYFYCPRSVVHDYYKRTCAKGSYFYCRKVELHIQLGVIRDYFRVPVHVDILSARAMSQGALTCISRDCAVLMSSDYRRHVLQEDESGHPTVLLGDSPNCHHLQIDESKFGKRKTQYTLLPILYKYCRRGSVIRSDGWAAYSSLHPQDSQNAYQNDTYVNEEQYATGDYFFSQHQVVNHSIGHATYDQPVLQSHGLACEANGILWRQKNKTDVMAGLERCLREIAMNLTTPSSELEGEVHEPSIFTRGTDGNPPEVQELMQTRAAIREARYLARFNRRTKKLRWKKLTICQDDNDYEGINQEAHNTSFVNSNWRSPSPVVVGNMSLPDTIDGSLSPVLLHELRSPSFSANEAAAVDEPILRSPTNSPIPSPIVRRTRTRGSGRGRGRPRSLNTTARTRGRNSRVNRR